MQSPRQEGASGALAMFLATGFGSGFSPVAPGTMGTVVAVPLGFFFVGLGPFAQLFCLAAVVAVAVWSAGIAAGRLGLKDPGQVVVDEIAGYLVTVALLPRGWVTLIAGFVLFRVFDVTKPPPCRRLEAIPGGTGIVADDLMAGIYANLAIRILCVSGILSL